MKPKQLWLIAAIFLIVHLFIHFEYIRPELLTGNKISLISFILANFIVFLGTAAPISLIIALIPFKHKDYGNKFKIVYPFVTIFVLLLAIFSFGHAAYSDKVNGLQLKVVNYNEIAIPENLYCSSVKEGKFENGFLYIERKGNVQTEIQKETNKKYTVGLLWISDCEYMVLPFKDHKDTTKVKIVSVTPDKYECYVGVGKDAMKMTFKRLK